MPRGSSTTRPPTTGPSTETVAPLNGEMHASVDGDVESPVFTEKFGTNESPFIEALSPLEAARNAVNSAVDDMVAKYVQDATVSRVGVAQLRDAIDELRQAIPRQRKRRAGD